jgi:type 1 glutamine amidotransferase
VPIDATRFSAKHRRMKSLALAFLLVGCVFADAAAAKLKVLLITGGHPYATNEFMEVFQKNPAIDFTHAVQAKNSSTAYDRDDLLSYDCIVLYDMMQGITESQKARLLEVLDRGIGLVVTHHALVSYQAWPEFENIVGGTYPEPQDKKGGVSEKLGYQHDVEMPIVIVAKDHPVTRGLSDFTITDEIYWGFRVSPEVTTLITTTQPKSGKPIAWAHNVRHSRVVYLQLGHGPTAYHNANYRKLLAQSIQWAAQGKKK